MTVGDQPFTKRAEAWKALENEIAVASAELGRGSSRLLGRFGPFPIRAEKDARDRMNYYLDFKKGDGAYLGSSSYDVTPRGIVQSAEEALATLDSRIDDRQKEIAAAKNQIEQMKEIVKQTFDGQPEINRLRDSVRELEDTLKAEAAAKEAERKRQSSPSADDDIAYQVPGGPEEAHAQAVVVADVSRLLARIAPGARAVAAPSIPTGRNTDAYGAYIQNAKTDLGTQHVIAWSLTSPDPFGTARHEVMHYLRRAGFIRPKEWDLLAKAAEDQGWRGAYKIRDRYPSLDDDRQIEEAVAERYADWGNGNRKNVTGIIERIFQALDRLRKRIVAAVRQAFGRDMTPEEFFAKIERGEIGRRKPINPDGDMQPAFMEAKPPSETPPTATEESYVRGLTDRLAAPIRAALRTEAAQKVVNGRTFQEASAKVHEISRQIGMLTDPIRMGPEHAQAIVKDFANEDRRITYHLLQLDKMITAKYPPEERAIIGRAIDEQSVMDQMGETDPERGLGRLKPDQRALAELLNNMSAKTWEGMLDASIVKGEGLPSYMPRVFVNIDPETGKVSRASSGRKADGSLPLEPYDSRVSTAGPLHRKYLEREETARAGKGALGPNAELVDDVRVLLRAVQRGQRSIAGKRLIDGIKELGQKAGVELVSDANTPGAFTLEEHPAFNQWRPRFAEDENGAWTPVKDADGNIIFDRKPIFVAREFEGPLRAILQKPPGVLWQAFMQAKNFGISIIMASPMTHNMVIFGKAFSLMPGKMLTLQLYRDGHMIRTGESYSTSARRRLGMAAPELDWNDPNRVAGAAIMDKLISKGMVPINGGWMRDITGVAEEAGMPPGRSLVSKLSGALAGAISGNEAKVKTRNAIDAAGKFWHGTLLWDRIADLQAGIAAQTRTRMMNEGLSEEAATTNAAQLANRFAGVLANESTSGIMRKILNFVLFSRSFTIGNVGIMKDSALGMPSDIYSQLVRDVGREMADAASKVLRSHSARSFLYDLALFYGMNAVIQTGIQGLAQYLNDPDGDALDKLGRVGTAIGQGYIRRAQELVARRNEHPLDWVDFRNLLTIPEEMMPQWDNEKNKQDRILVGTDDRGRAIYVRNPFGKVGEEFKNWLTQPITQLGNKLSPFIKPLAEIAMNEDFSGHKIFSTDKTNSMTADLGALGAMLTHIMKAQGADSPLFTVPGGIYQAISEAVQGKSVSKLDLARSLLPATGLSISRGDVLGPRGSVLRGVADRQKDAYLAAYPKIVEDVVHGRTEDAAQKLFDLGDSADEARRTIKGIQNPQKKTLPSGYLGRQFREHATPADRKRLEHVNQ
jgi:hypothetical protein